MTPRFDRWVADTLNLQWAVSPRLWRQLLQNRATLGLLLLAIVASILGSGFWVWESLQRGEFISALAARDGDRLGKAAWQLALILVSTAILLSLSTYLRERLGLVWRQQLTHEILSRYLQQQRYYHLRAQPDLDNPDQRMSEDIRYVTQYAIGFLGLGLESVVQLVGFVGVLWSISGQLTAFLALYGLLGTAITLGLFGRRLTVINREQLMREANFRFGLIDLGEQAESIAFYQGQSWQQQRLTDQFQAVVQVINRWIRWQLGLDFWQNGYQYLTFIGPSLILAPQILSGHLEVGAIVQSEAAFDRIWLAISLVVLQFEQLTALAASAQRLGELKQALQQVNPVESCHHIQIVHYSQVGLENLSLLTPDGRRQILNRLSVTVPPGRHLLICGPSGVGKSSLVRAIAGLWSIGEGTIYRPGGSALLFLPQRPYLLTGSLRQQLIYPHRRLPTSDHQLRQILRQVQLDVLAEVDLDTLVDWPLRLSGGEQQRLAFARLLLHQPVYAVLDEATSALALEQERQLYDQLSQTTTTFISVGHRSSLAAYHRQCLSLRSEGAWSLAPLPKRQVGL